MLVVLKKFFKLTMQL